MRFLSLLQSRLIILSLSLLLSLSGCSKSAPDDSVDSKPPEMTGDEGKMVPPP